MAQVSFKVQNRNPLSCYVISFLLRTAGIKPVEINPKDDCKVDISYGDISFQTKSNIRIIHNVSDPFNIDIINGEESIDAEGFDVINAVSQLLTDTIHSRMPSEAFDEHGRLRFKSSLQAKNKIGDIPIVNVYLEKFKGFISKELNLSNSDFLPLWPEGKKCAIGLSHDVDIPLKKVELFRGRYESSGIQKAKKIIKFYRERFRDKAWNDYWLFDEVMDEEEKYGFTSTFYFASRNRNDSDSGIGPNVGYNIAWPCFKRTFDNMRERGFSIGLHASYNAYLKEDYLREELKRLSKISGGNVKGIRHHYWHLGPNPNQTFQFHNDIGLLYDSSIAFNDHMGFRNNVALPFNIFNVQNRQELDIIELPTFCMDGNIFYHQNDPQEGIRKILVSVNTIKQNKGIGVIDWHVKSSYPKNKKFNNWGVAYRGILKALAEDKNIWVTSPEVIYSWLKNREEKLRN